MQFAEASDGTKIAYRLDTAITPGKEPTGTVFMHHGLGFNGEAWQHWLPSLLDRGLQVIRIDMRGHGQSDKPGAGHAWSTDQLCADISLVLDRAQVKNCHLVGESWGGTLVLAWALKNLNRAKTITVMSTTFDGSLVPRLDTFAPMIRKQGINAWSKMMVEARFMSDIDPDIARWCDHTQNACIPHVIADMSEYILGEKLQVKLPALNVPVLILAAQGSPFVKPEMAVALLNMLPDAELHRFPGHRHGLVLSGAKIGSQELATFIQRRG